LVNERYTNVRANVWFDGLDARSRGRVLVAAELPLLYALGRSRDPPEIRYPDSEQDARTTPATRPTPPLTVRKRLRDVCCYRNVQPVTSDSSDPSARAF